MKDKTIRKIVIDTKINLRRLKGGYKGNNNDVGRIERKQSKRTSKDN